MRAELVDRWIAGWSRLRDVAVEDRGEHRLVHVDGPSRRTELVCLAPRWSALDGLLPQVNGDPTAMLTVVADDRRPYQRLTLPAPVRVDRDDEMLMHLDLARPVTPSVPTGMRGELSTDDARSRYELVHDERVVAWASMGVHDGWATFDRVETIPSYRRRGLGRHVMAALTNVAIDRGATEGVLAASTDGQALYRTLGWTRSADLWSLMGA